MILAAPDVRQHALGVDDRARIEPEVLVEQPRRERRGLFAQPAAQVRQRFDARGRGRSCSSRHDSTCGVTRVAGIRRSRARRCSRACNARAHRRDLRHEHAPSHREHRRRALARPHHGRGCRHDPARAAHAQTAGASHRCVRRPVASAAVDRRRARGSAGDRRRAERHRDHRSSHRPRRPAARLTEQSVLATSGNRWIDRAALAAARQSRYRAEVRGCAPVGGVYAFVVDFTR